MPETSDFILAFVVCVSLLVMPELELQAASALLHQNTII